MQNDSEPRTPEHKTTPKLDVQSPYATHYLGTALEVVKKAPHRILSGKNSAEKKNIRHGCFKKMPRKAMHSFAKDPAIVKKDLGQITSGRTTPEADGSYVVPQKDGTTNTYIPHDPNSSNKSKRLIPVAGSNVLPAVSGEVAAGINVLTATSPKSEKRRELSEALFTTPERVLSTSRQTLFDLTGRLPTKSPKRENEGAHSQPATKRQRTVSQHLPSATALFTSSASMLAHESTHPQPATKRQCTASLPLPGATALFPDTFPLRPLP